MNKQINEIDIKNSGPFSGNISPDGLLEGLCSYEEWELLRKSEWYAKANIDPNSYKFTDSGSFSTQTQQAVDLAGQDDDGLDDDDYIILDWTR